MIEAELVGHDDHTVVRHALGNPVVPADGFQPPHLVFISKGHAVRLIGAVLLQQCAHAQHAFAGGMDIGQDHRHQILLAQAAGHLLFAALSGLIRHIGIGPQHPGIGGNGLGCRHGHIGGVNAASRPHAVRLGHIGRHGIAHGIVGQLHLQMRNHGFIGSFLILGLNHNQPLGLKAAVIVARNQRRTVVGSQLAGQNRRAGHCFYLLMYS